MTTHRDVTDVTKSPYNTCPLMSTRHEWARVDTSGNAQPAHDGQWNGGRKHLAICDDDTRHAVEVSFFFLSWGRNKASSNSECTSYQPAFVRAKSQQTSVSAKVLWENHTLVICVREAREARRVRVRYKMWLLETFATASEYSADPFASGASEENSERGKQSLVRSSKKARKNICMKKEKRRKCRCVRPHN